MSPVHALAVTGVQMAAAGGPNARESKCVAITSVFNDKR